MEIKLSVIDDGQAVHNASIEVAAADLPRVLAFVAAQPQYNRVRKSAAELEAEKQAHIAKYADSPTIPEFRPDPYKEEPAEPMEALGNCGREWLAQLFANTVAWERQQQLEAKRREVEESIKPIEIS